MPKITREPGPLPRSRDGKVLALLRLRTLDESVAAAHALVDEAIQEVVDEGKELVGVYGLYSGGNDSTTFMHVMRERMDGAIHVNTGIGIPETRRFVRATCRSWGIPLKMCEPEPGSGNTYEELVLRFGFPGPGGHGVMYRRLKERQLRTARRDLVSDGRKQRVIFLSGMRVFESSRRFRNAAEIEREGSIVWVCPIIHWTSEHMREYRRRFDIPRNPVSDHLHMSGECLCGAFAKPGELEQIRFFYPEVAEEIDRLQEKAHSAGVHCVWGTRPPKAPRYGAGDLTPEDDQRLCHKCVRGVDA